MRIFQIIMSLVAVVVIVIVVLIATQSSHPAPHRPNAADDAFATVKLQ